MAKPGAGWDPRARRGSIRGLGGGVLAENGRGGGASVQPPAKANRATDRAAISQTAPGTSLPREAPSFTAA
jgi:hypothetical protein